MNGQISKKHVHSGKTIQRLLCGHVWQHPPDVRPQVFCAMEADIRQLNAVRSNRHKRWAIDYTYSDAGVFHVGARTTRKRVRSAGLVRLFAPGATYWDDTRAVTAPLHTAYVVFQGGEACGLNTLTDTDGFTSRIDTDGRIGALLHKMAAVGDQQGDQGFWEVQAMLNQLISWWHHPTVIRDDQTELGDDTSPLIRKTRAYLRRHYDAPVTLAMIARELNVSVSTLTHRYRQHTGRTPMAALRQIRVRAAMLLMMQGERLAQVAPQVGFCDAFALSRAFKRHTGISPRQWLAGKKASTNK